MELGIYSFVEAGPDPVTGQLVDPAVRIKHLMEEIELADQLGLDVFGIGEHHRSEYLASSPTTLLAAAAVKTKQIRLSSAVTVLSSEDPVRVFQQFATVDLLSEGRAEIIAGRGSFTESFPLFGYDLQDYNTLFSEKLELMIQLLGQKQVTWAGKHRAALDSEVVFPRPVQNPIPLWIAVGGTPASVVRAATLGMPLAVAIIGGQPARFAPLVELYRVTARQAGHDLSRLPVSINSHGFIADTTERAIELAYPAYVDTMGRIGSERGWAPPNRHQFDAERSEGGAMLVGNPQEIIDKILYEYELFKNQRFLIQFTLGTTPHEDVMRCIELFGTVVAPAVREKVGRISKAAVKAE